MTDLSILKKKIENAYGGLILNAELLHELHKEIVTMQEGAKNA